MTGVFAMKNTDALLLCLVSLAQDVCLFLFLRSELYLWGENFVYVTFLFFFLPNHRSSYIPSSWIMHAGCVFAASMHPPKT